MANSQDIEARLCAYIEGELGPLERAEIERHLEASPGHRQMMADLVRTRSLMGGLPRLNAPADLGEGLQAHLERSMLLGRGLSGDEPRTGWRSRWSQAAILAAVVMLSVGFGSLVYYMVHVASHPAEVGIPVAAQTPPPSQVTPPVVDAPLPAVAMNPVTRPSDTQPSQLADVDMAADAPPATQESPPTTQEAVAAGPTTQEVIAEAIPATEPSAPATLPSDADDDLENVAVPAGFTGAPATQPSVDLLTPTTAPVADDAAGK